MDRNEKPIINSNEKDYLSDAFQAATVHFMTSTYVKCTNTLVERPRMCVFL